MKPLSEQNHYEILEISRDATGEEIERSFRMAQSTYADDSLAGYSVFGEGEAQAIRERIEIAYCVLSDVESRSAYDASLAAGTSAAPAFEDRIPEIELPELPELPAPAAKVRHSGVAGELESLEDENGEFDGAHLRRSRLRCGVELGEIAGITKINPTYLRFIEEDRYTELPAPVYVRGFVTAYADCIGLDAKRVAASYMKKFEAKAGRLRPGRFFAGR